MYSDAKLRQTGRTTRALEDAVHLITQAGDFRKVIYLVPSVRLVDYVMELLKHNLHTASYERLNFSHYTTCTASNGILVVQAVDVRHLESEVAELVRGEQRTILRFDHSVMEFYERLLIQRYSFRES
jgi:hypothetical protein